MGENAIIGRTVQRGGGQTCQIGGLLHTWLGPVRSSKPARLRPVLEYPDFSEIKAVLDPIPIYLIGGLALLTSI